MEDAQLGPGGKDGDVSAGSLLKTVLVRFGSLESGLEEVKARLDAVEGGSSDSSSNEIAEWGESQALDRGEPMPFDVAMMPNDAGMWELHVYVPGYFDFVWLDGDPVPEKSSGEGPGWRSLGSAGLSTKVWLVVEYDEETGAQWYLTMASPPYSDALWHAYVPIAAFLMSQPSRNFVLTQFHHGAVVLTRDKGKWAAPGAHKPSVAKNLGGSGKTPDTETWEYGDKDESTGMRTYPVFSPARFFWDEEDHTLWQFRRTETFNPDGLLVKVSEEVRTPMFTAVKEMP